VRINEIAKMNLSDFSFLSNLIKAVWFANNTVHNCLNVVCNVNAEEI